MCVCGSTLKCNNQMDNHFRSGKVWNVCAWFIIQQVAHTRIGLFIYEVPQHLPQVFEMYSVCHKCLKCIQFAPRVWNVFSLPQVFEMYSACHRCFKLFHSDIVVCKSWAIMLSLIFSFLPSSARHQLRIVALKNNIGVGESSHWTAVHRERVLWN